MGAGGFDGRVRNGIGSLCPRLGHQAGQAQPPAAPAADDRDRMSDVGRDFRSLASGHWSLVSALGGHGGWEAIKLD